jgi:aspartate racemase
VADFALGTGGIEMKTIGLIGGMSWESSIEYYRIINETIREALGGLHSAKSVMYSVDFAEIEVLQKEGKWEEATRLMVEAAQHVESGGADFLLICTNTMHRMADDVQEGITIPLLHIADATAERIKQQRLHKIGLLGTRFTMEEDFYKGRLSEKYGLEVIIPDQNSRDVIHNVIYNELVMGSIKPASKRKYLEIINHLVERGVEGTILGCTEIALLIGQDDVRIPVFDTTHIHATAAVEYALTA